jgi:hypothetical protein
MKISQGRGEKGEERKGRKSETGNRENEDVEPKRAS